ncbi:hypothetical protein FHU38_001866 [Saccharomonospora amisosensis]|uniref:Coenzyme Q-binding protein COQ10 START domain-containing protein n=1 Tax=Saccharomonospora amisosensis TaxID=1128677 RepID=A0A7X5UNZ8_9PSEU|nr:SRPBCC family protein [Saccharomonospora amisosensis]NIJ11522.1 hypothetical protein [Saccharomonospora amisosensis]
MSLTSYLFRATWTINASPDAVFAAVVDVASYPRWWPDVRSVRPCDDDSGANDSGANDNGANDSGGADTDTALLVCRSTLPLPITVRMRRVEQNRPAGRVAVALTGDLEGILTGLVLAEDGTRLEITQRVVVRTRLLRSLSLVAHPLLRVNHAMMMRRGLRGLRAHVDSG